MADIDLLPEVRLAGAMPVQDRLAVYRDAVCRSLVSLSVDIPDGDRFTAYVRARPLGVLRMTEVQSKPQIVRRTPRLINADDERFLKVGMLLTGRCVVTQHGREAALGPGDLVCYDTAAPYGFLMQSPFALAVFMMPATHVEHRLRGFDQVTATAFSGREGLGAVVAEMLRALHAGREHNGRSGPPCRRRSRQPCRRPGGPAQWPALDENAGAAALRARVRRYIEEHLADPGLTAADIAAACGISVRYLYKLFELEGTAVSACIRNRRLDQVVARSSLHPRLAHCSIARIGARWGFADAAAFEPYVPGPTGDHRALVPGPALRTPYSRLTEFPARPSRPGPAVHGWARGRASCANSGRLSARMPCCSGRRRPAAHAVQRRRPAMSVQHPKFRAAAVQAAPVFLDLDATIDKSIALIAEAS